MQAVFARLVVDAKISWVCRGQARRQAPGGLWRGVIVDKDNAQIGIIEVEL